MTTGNTEFWPYRALWQSDVSAFKYALLFCQNFPFKEQASLNFMGALIVQLEKNLPAMQETRVWFLGWEDSPCQLQISIYQDHCQWLSNKDIRHLLLWILNPIQLQLLTFNNPQGGSVWSEALCVPGTLVGPVFRELHVFRKRFYYLNPCISS